MRLRPILSRVHAHRHRHFQWDGYYHVFLYRGIEHVQLGAVGIEHLFVMHPRELAAGQDSPNGTLITLSISDQNHNQIR